MMGRETGREVDSGPEADLCLFLGCGSSVEVARYFDRTGTGVVIRVVARGRSGAGMVSGGTVGTGFRVVVSRFGFCSSTSRG